MNFNPRAPCGARLSKENIPWLPSLFQSTRPVRGATKNRVLAFTLDAFQSTRPVRGATLTPKHGKLSPCISIHAPRAGRDPVRCVTRPLVQDFNPRAPCGARRGDIGGLGSMGKISIHAPRAGRDAAQQVERRRQAISIHAPRAGRDANGKPCTVSTYISIHAPRAGRDAAD